MNIFNNHKIRWSIISFLAVLQITSVTIFSDSYSGNLFYFVNLSYFVLGFFSLDVRQALKNISLVTLPVVIMIVFFLLLIAVLSGKINGVIVAVEVAFTLWTLILLIAVPVFVFGFGIRTLSKFIISMKKYD